MLRYLCLIVCFFLFAVPQSSVMTQDPPPLSAPTDLSASVSAEGITLTWTAPDGRVDGYEILRQRPLQSETELSALVDDTGNSDASYTDTSATAPGESYIYGVKAIRGAERSEASETVSVVFVSVSCELSAGDNHAILECSADVGDVALTSVQWIPNYEPDFRQTTERAEVSWTVASEYCGQLTSVVAFARTVDAVLPSVETPVHLDCEAPESDSVLSVKCEVVLEDSEYKLRCALSGGDEVVDYSVWTVDIGDVQLSHVRQGEDATETAWALGAGYCGQNANVRVNPLSDGRLLDAVTVFLPLPCAIIVDDNCSLANAIRSANGNSQVEESGDSDGNDDCESGADENATASPPYRGDDIILLTRNVTLTADLPSITSRVQFDGSGYTISGDAKYSVFTVVGGQLSARNVTITKALADDHGGGVYVNSGSLSVSDSDIKDNQANDIGGGIYAIDSDVDIANTKFTGNSTVKSHGAAVYFISSTGLHKLDIYGATFRENTATEDGGALKTAGGIATIRKSTFIENQADEGGAIESSETTLDITNSTFSGNSAREGGGLSSFSSDVTLTHTTWAYNSAAEQGGGIAIIGWTGSFKMRNTLITDSVSGGDCHSGPNPNIIIEFTGNFIKDGSCTPEPAESQAAASDSAEAQAQAVEVAEAQAVEVAEAQIRGGSGDPVVSEELTGNPPYHELPWESPAIDAADPRYCSLDDQPFTARPQFGNCDIGAYEYPKPPPPPAQPDPPDPPDDDPPDAPDDPPDPPEDTPEPPPPAATPTASPVPPTPTLAPDCIHIVKAGENLFRIAILYNMTVREISSFNNLLRDDRLSVGQELIIPFEHCHQIPRKG